MGILNDIGKIFYESTVEKGQVHFPNQMITDLGWSNDGMINLNNQNEQQLINDGYGSNVTAYSIINKILTTGIRIPFIVWDKNKDEEVEVGRLFDILKNPAVYRGDSLSTNEWKEIAMAYMLTSGNLYQQKLNLTTKRYFDGYEVMPSGIIEPKVTNSFLLPNSGFVLYDKQNTKHYLSDEISHLKYINPTTIGLNTLKGLSPLQAGLYALTGSTDIQKAQSVLVKNQGVRGVLTNESNRNGSNVNAGEGDIKKFKSALNNTIRGIDKINSVHITNASLKYLAMGMSTADLKLIESVVLTDRQLCNAYNVDSVLFNDQASSTRDNKTIAEKGLYVNAILPLLNKIIDKFNQDITKGINREERTNLEVRIDTSGIEALQKDQKLEADKNRVNALGIKDVLASPTDMNGKIEILMTIYGYDEEKAIKIVGNGQNTED